MPEPTSHTTTSSTSNDTSTSEIHKLTAATSIVRRALTWYDGDKFAFIPIEREVIDKLRLTRDDLFTQEVTPEGGILLRRFKGTF